MDKVSRNMELAARWQHTATDGDMDKARRTLAVLSKGPEQKSARFVAINGLDADWDITDPHMYALWAYAEWAKANGSHSPSAIGGEDKRPSGKGTRKSSAPSTRATDKQLWFIHKLLKERDGNVLGKMLFDVALRGAYYHMINTGEITGDPKMLPISKRDASDVIEILKDAPYRTDNAPKGHAVKPKNSPKAGTVDKPNTASANGQELKPGLYENPENGEIYRVRQSRSSGKVYAGIHKGNGYVPGLIKNIRPEWLVTLEKAMAYGRKTGICMMCSKRLTNAESVERGIGPICAGKF